MRNVSLTAWPDEALALYKLFMAQRTDHGEEECIVQAVTAIQDSRTYELIRRHNPTFEFSEHVVWKYTEQQHRIIERLLQFQLQAYVAIPNAETLSTTVVMISIQELPAIMAQFQRFGATWWPSHFATEPDCKKWLKLKKS